MFILTSAFIAFFVITVTAKKDCNEIVVNAEKCLKATLFMGDTAVPHTVNDWKSYSKVYSNSVKCLKKLQKCYTGLQRQVAVMATTGVTNLGRYLFGKNANITKHLHAIQCINDQMVTDLQQCLIGHSTRLQFISTRLSDNTLVELCCSMRLGEQCTFTAIESNCKVAKKEALKFFQRIFRVVMGDTADLMCSKQSSLKICEDNFNDIIKQLRQVDSARYETDEFILRPFFRIMAQMSL